MQCAHDGHVLFHQGQDVGSMRINIWRRLGTLGLSNHCFCCAMRVHLMKQGHKRRNANGKMHALVENNCYFCLIDHGFRS
eukprot:1416684-Amphidinium_carterae.1